MGYSRAELLRKAEGLRDRWRYAPELYCKEALGLQLWDKQRQLLQALADAPRKTRRVSRKSGHKIGKSTSAAAAALWWPIVYPRGRVILTAPAGHQVRNILWPEVTRLYKNAKAPLGGHLSPDPTRGWILPDGSQGIVGVTTDDVERFAGLSAPYTLVIVDEANGFIEKLWPAVFGNLAGGGAVLAIGNPTRPTGTFYDSFGAKSHMWDHDTISSATTPNVRHNRAIVPGLAMREYVLDALCEYAGTTLDPNCSHEELLAALAQASHPQLSIRVTGEYSKTADRLVCDPGDIEHARMMWADEPWDGELELGVDVARYGDDDSVIVYRRGKKSSLPLRFHHRDGNAIAKEVIAVVAERRIGREWTRVKVDVIGVGAAVVDALADKANAERIIVVPVNVSASASNPRLYANQRAEAWFAMSAWLKHGGTIAEDQKLHSELVAPTYELNERGQYKVESKDKIKSRIGRSPDAAEALLLAVYNPPTITDMTVESVGGRYSR